MCGIRLVYEQDSEEFVETLAQCMLECPNQYHESYHLNLLAQVEELQGCDHGKDFSCSFSLQRRPRMPKLLPSIENVAEEEGCTSSETFSNQAGTSTSLILGVPLRDEQCGSTTSSIGALEDWFKLYLKHTHNNRDAFSLCFPQSEIPQWFCYKNDHKPSVGILLPPNLYYNPDWMGFAVCGVFSFHKHPTAINLNSGFRHCFMFHLATDLGCVSPLLENCIREAEVRIYQRSFIWLLFLPRWSLSQQWSEVTWANFSFVSDSPHVSALKCGVGLVYRENMEEFNATYVQLMTSFVATVEDIRSSLSLPQISYPPPLEKEMQCEDPHPVHNTGPLDFHPSSSFNYCFPPSKVTQEWFSHKSRGHSVTIDMPANLYNDNNWMGLALCACFSIDGDSEALTGNWVSKIPHFVHCLFRTSEAGLDDYVHMWGTNGADIMWLIDLGRFIWISYQPGDPFRYLLRQCSSIEASIVSDWPGVTVQKCGLHLLYQHDRVEFEQKLKHCNDLMFEYVESINPLRYDLAKIFGQSPDQEVGLRPTPDDHSMENFLNQTFKRPIDQAETDQLGISDLMDFDGCSEFNLCLPPREILHWFSHQSNEPSVKIDVPTNLYDDSGWMGLLLCAYFSVHDQDQTEKLDSAISHQLICCLKSNVVGPEPELHVHGTTKQVLRQSYIQDEFLWLSYIPRGSLPDWLNQCSCLEASFLSDSPGLMVQKCGLRFFHVHDEEFEKIIFRWGFYPSIPIDHGESSGDENQPCNNQDFDPCLFYNSCFPPNEILDSFSHQSDEPSVTIRLPPNLYDDPTWMGLALCVFFSVQEHYTIPCNLNCLLETAIGSLEIPLVYCLNEEDLMLLRLGGFIWLSYIPRGSFPNWLNQSSVIQALIATNCQGLTAQRCGLRLLYQNEEIGFKQTIRQLSLTREDKAAEPSATSNSDDPRPKDNGKRIVE